MHRYHEDLSALSISSEAVLREALAAIDRGARQIALVIDSEGRLIGTVTDGDIRRALLRGVTLESPVKTVMHTAFVSAKLEEGPEVARDLMIGRKIHQIPIVDDRGRPVHLVHLDDLSGLTERNTLIVLMAGGLGTRLRPLTETVPKPMLKIGDKPILEKIISSFVSQGFRRFIVSLNYKGDMIRDHFGDGTRIGGKIDYVEETKRLGTAGSLSMLTCRPDEPFVVMNGDLLTTLQFDALLSFHTETKAVATMCVREYSVQVPYGVLEFDGTQLRSITEKPTHFHFVNAGIYVLSPEVLDHIESDTWLDMPTLFERLIEEEKVVSVFPLQEHWIDIGRMEDLERARAEFAEEPN